MRFARSEPGARAARAPHGLVRRAPAGKSINCAAMRRLARWLAVLGFGLGFIGSAGPVAAARPPVVVELFTAQGCSSCVDTGALINSLSADPRVIALAFGVDYWDYLGWSDTF